MITVAEGAGQNLFSDQLNAETLGNILKQLSAVIYANAAAYFGERDIPTSLKYFDPNYSIRSVSASGTDQILRHRLAEYAVHAAMAGKDKYGKWLLEWDLVNIPTLTYERQKIDPEGSIWKSVMACTGQAKVFVTPADSSVVLETVSKPDHLS